MSSLKISYLHAVYFDHVRTYIPPNFSDPLPFHQNLMSSFWLLTHLMLYIYSWVWNHLSTDTSDWDLKEGNSD